MLRTFCPRLIRASPVLRICRAGAHSRRVPQTHPAILIDGNEYTKEAEYPPIAEISYKTNLLKKRESWYDHIKDIATVEEKQIALNIPRYYGYKCVMLTDDKFHYNSLPFVQHSTRTAIRATGLPEYYEPLRARAEKHVAAIREDIESAIVFETIGYVYVVFDCGQNQMIFLGYVFILIGCVVVLGLPNRMWRIIRRQRNCVNQAPG